MLSSVFSVSDDDCVFYSFIVSVCCITLINFHMLNLACIPGINST